MHRAHEPGVPVGRFPRSARCAHRTTGAAEVLDDDLLAQGKRELRGERPREHIGAAADRKRVDDLDRLLRPRLCPGARAADAQREYKRREGSNRASHDDSSPSGEIAAFDAALVLGTYSQYPHPASLPSQCAVAIVASPSPELGLLLGKKRPVTDPVILGAESREAFVVLVGSEWSRVGEAARELLVPAGDERGARCDTLRGRGCFLLDPTVGHDAIDEAFRLRLLRAEDAAFEHDFERGRTADEIDQTLHLAVSHDQPQILHRHAESARLRADAQIADRGHLESAADAYAADHRHD